MRSSQRPKSARLSLVVGHANKEGTVNAQKRSSKPYSSSFTIVPCTAAFAYDPIDCLNDIAKIDPEINIGSATQLCSGAWTPEPAKCYGLISKKDKGIIRGIAIELCAGSVNSEKTIDCYVKAGTERKLNRGLSTTLCSARKSKN